MLNRFTPLLLLAIFAEVAAGFQIKIDTELVAKANQTVSSERLRALHDVLASEPHVAGTPGDARTIDRLMSAFTDAGLKPWKHEFVPLLAKPVEAELEIISPERISLSVKEYPALGDSDTDHPDLTIGWNAYSGSGEVTGEVVYAHFGRDEDFARLKELGIDVKDKIVLARYGGNYRGYKVKFAEAAGAKGLIIFSDPADVGFVLGPGYPEGTFYNECCIQRGSIVTLGYQGDPLTPGICATHDAPRLREEETALPRIPVQPIGFGPAREILARMQGERVPEDWQGGFKNPYKLTGGAELLVRLKVIQKRELTPTANVLAQIEGAIYPDEKVIIGCHHDAWNHGAADPTCGTIAVLEAARVLKQLADHGHRPARTIIFATWGAEEFGIIGSSEWVEGNIDDLISNGVAYLNLDMASMGLNFGASATPSLRAVIRECAKLVPAASKSDGSPIIDAGFGDIGSLGGGSDHVAFICHAAVPSVAFSSGGSKGSSYHTAYDTLRWYRKTVGEDYASPTMITRMTCAFAIAMGWGDRIPYDPAANFAEAATHAQTRSKEPGAHPAWAVAHDIFEPAARHVASLPDGETRLVNSRNMKLERVWLSDRTGLSTRPWFRNHLVATDEYSGYGSWVLPAVTGAIKRKDEIEVERALGACRDIARRARSVESH
ncbi:MAG: M28 family peptidase [Phycisphaerales bacterium]